MPIDQNLNKWMTLVNSTINGLQMFGGIAGKKDSSAGDSNPKEKEEKQKKPGLMAWFSPDDERIMAQLLIALKKRGDSGEEKVGLVMIFLDSLAPAAPRTLAERLAKKINLSMFRHVVVGLDIKTVQKVLTSTDSGVGDKKKTVKTYDDPEVTDYRVDFLEWIADQTRALGADEVRRQLALTNIIASDESMEASTTKISSLIESTKELPAHLNNLLDSSNKKLKKVNLIIWIALLPTIIAVGILIRLDKSIFAALLAISVILLTIFLPKILRRIQRRS